MAGGGTGLLELPLGVKIPLLPGSKPVFCRTKLGEKVKGVERGRKALLFDGVPIIQRSPCGHLLYNGRCRPSMWQRWGVEGSSWLAGTETKTGLVGFLACFWQRASERPGPCLQQAAVCLGAGPMCPSFGLLKQCRARLWGALEGESKLLLLALLAYLEKLGLLCLRKPRSVLLLLQLAVHFSQGRDFLEAELVDTALGPAEPRGDCFQCLMQLLPLNCRACTFHSEGSFLLWQGLPGGLRCLLCWWGLSSLPQPSPAQPSAGQPGPAVWLGWSRCLQKDGEECWSCKYLYLFTSPAWHLFAALSCLLPTLATLSYSFTSPLVISIWEIHTAAS